MTPAASADAFRPTLGGSRTKRSNSSSGKVSRKPSPLTTHSTNGSRGFTLKARTHKFFIWRYTP
nr:MAG TPA: hypothetical protein [Caudoviricetes sp.]